MNVSDNSTVAELAQMWYSVYKKPHLKKGGQNAAKNAVNNHILPVIGAMKVRDVRPVNIRRVMANLEGMSQSTHDKVRQALKGTILAGVLLYCSSQQALKGPPSLGSFSIYQLPVPMCGERERLQ